MDPEPYDYHRVYATKPNVLHRQIYKFGQALAPLNPVDPAAGRPAYKAPGTTAAFGGPRDDSAALDARLRLGDNAPITVQPANVLVDAAAKRAGVAPQQAAAALSPAAKPMYDKEGYRLDPNGGRATEAQMAALPRPVIPGTEAVANDGSKGGFLAAQDQAQEERAHPWNYSRDTWGDKKSATQLADDEKERIKQTGDHR